MKIKFSTPTVLSLLRSALFRYFRILRVYPLSALRATSPTRRTRPFCRYRDISPVSAGEFTPKEEAIYLSLRGSEATKQTPGRVSFRKAYTLSLWSWDISLTLNMTYFFTCLCERSEAISREGEGLRSIFSVLFQGDCRGTSCLAMTTSRTMVRWNISLALNMTKSPLSALRATSPEGGSKICHCEGAKRPRQSVGITVGVYTARFTHGDRHACARDDSKAIVRWDISLALNIT